MNNSYPIGIFDSGVGGLSVLTNISHLLPNENLIYVADSKYAPYGGRSNEEIFNRSRKIINFLIQNFNSKAIVIGCNTATAACIKELREIYSFPIIGMEPAIKPAKKLTKSKRIGILATSGTLQSSKFAALLSDYKGDTKFFSQPCLGLVEQIEKGEFDSKETRQIVIDNLSILKSKNVDVIILGCTHFVFITHIVKEFFEKSIPIINTGHAVARQLKSKLEQNNLCNLKKLKKDLIFCTNNDEKTSRKILEFLIPNISYKFEIFN